MGLLSALKSILGLDGDDAGTGRARGGDVTVEREADAGSERAVETGADGDDHDGESAGRAESAETAGPESDAAPTGGDADSGPDSPADGTDDERDVRTVKGIGPAYADRLSEVDVDTVSDLLAADPEAVAEGTSVGAGRVETWQERAAEED